MKKWAFWITMCIVSILNGVFFFEASARAMNRGLEGVDNQAALLFIPFLWIIAVLVLVTINGYTLVRGIKIERNQIIGLFDIFQLSGLSKKAKAYRIAFFIITGLLILLGYSLFAEEVIWAVSYAISGGVLLLFLYIWKKASVECGHAAS